jgi:dolichol kinase
MPQIVGGAALAGVVLLALLAANVLKDRGVPLDVTRRVLGALGGGVYLAAVLFLEPTVAIVAAVAIAGIFVVLRVSARRHLRGLAGDGRSDRLGELAYPVAAAASLAVGWGLFGDRWLAFVPIAFMAWGDNAAGLVRARWPRTRDTEVWPSAAMLGVCAAAALLLQPFWIGAIGAVLATVAERLHPTTHPLWDDNWVVVAASLPIMTALTVA